MKWMILLLVLLISCAPATQEIIAKPAIQIQPETPKTAPQPVLQPEVKAPAVQPPAPVTAPSPQLTPLQECVGMCQENCKATAQNACTQKERSTCKAVCGDSPTIDPSACTQACTYITQPNQCKVMMEQFCSANCVKQCH
ncbi:Uncharacterised protein [uncultured archaeon]|nr:Uncharacterised protein [uncultured archaeon]